jgi:PTS system ascorbate-specific IIB component
MMMRSVEKGLTEMGFKITKIHHCSIAEGKSSAAQYDVVFTPMNFLNMFDAVKEKGITVIGIRNVMSAKEVQEKVKETDLEQKYK